MGKHSLPDGVYVPGSSASDARLNGVEDTVPIPVVRPTQVEHSWRATVRTIFQVVVALAVILPFVVTAAGIPVTVGVGAAVVGVCAAVTKVMALPQVNEFIDRFAPWLRAE